MKHFAELCNDASAAFLVRWRGRQEGPHPAAVIEAKLAAHEFGLLHEIFHNGKWVTIRDFIAEREGILRSQHEAQTEKEQQAREAAERQAKAREEQQRAALLAEERKRNEILRPTAADRTTPEPFKQDSKRKPHRAGFVLTLAIVGLFIFGPLCLAACLMGAADLREMDANLMDPLGRSTTKGGITVGIIGTILWILGAIVYFKLST